MATMATTIDVFTPEELQTFYGELSTGEFVKCDKMGGCHTYINLSPDYRRDHLETVVTYDGVYFTMGMGDNWGLKKIDETSPKDIVEWYNEYLGAQGKSERYELGEYIVDSVSNASNRHVVVMAV